MREPLDLTDDAALDALLAEMGQDAPITVDVADRVMARVAFAGPVPGTDVALGQLATAYYFAHFLIILPLISKFERTLPLPSSISESVLHGEKAESAPLGSRPAAATAN